MTNRVRNEIPWLTSGGRHGRLQLTGYHITSHDNWRGIRRHGLCPSHISGQRDVENLLHRHGFEEATWIWDSLPAGEDLVGCIFDRVVSKLTRHVVIIEVRYTTRDLLVDPAVVLTHNGCFSNDHATAPWTYHHRRPFKLLLRRIPPTRLRVIWDVDLEKLFEAQFQKG